MAATNTPPHRTIENPFLLHTSHLYPIHYSLVICKIDGDVPETILSRCYDIANRYFINHLFTFDHTSRTRHNHVHMEGHFTAMSQNTARATRAARACIKSAIPIDRSTHINVYVNPITPIPGTSTSDSFIPHCIQ